MNDNRRQARIAGRPYLLVALSAPLAWLVFASGLGHLAGSFTALIAPGLAHALVTPVFVLQLGEPMMIRWLVLAGATRGSAQRLTPAAAS
jgi:hypothetical protein